MKEIIPKKSLGQHWLYDDTALEAICESANVQAGDVVLEVGPGLGTLTRKLLARGATVTAVEFDTYLAQNLAKTLSETHSEDSPLKLGGGGSLTVVESDILRFNLQQLPEGFKVVANIPYYLTSNLIRVLCESPNHFSTAAILVQKEVAERVTARPGQMSILSVSAQFYCQTSLGVVVPAKLFTPPPKVDSQVLILRYRDQPLFQGIDSKVFFQLVKAGFSQKRKTLENSLSAGLKIEKSIVREKLERVDIPYQTRAQALSLDQWNSLYKELSLG